MTQPQPQSQPMMTWRDVVPTDEPKGWRKTTSRVNTKTAALLHEIWFENRANRQIVVGFVVWHSDELKRDIVDILAGHTRGKHLSLANRATIIERLCGKFVASGAAEPEFERQPNGNYMARYIMPDTAPVPAVEDIKTQAQTLNDAAATMGIAQPVEET